MDKCVKCGAVLKHYNDKKTGWYFYPNLKTGFPRKRSNYTFKYRMVCNARYGNRNHRTVCISMDIDEYNAAICIDCYIQELKKALYAAENLAEKIHNGVNPEEDPEQEQEPKEQPKKKPEIIVPSAEEIKREYPEWVKLVTKTNNGVPLEDEDLREIFRMQRKIGAV